MFLSSLFSLISNSPICVGSNFEIKFDFELFSINNEFIALVKATYSLFLLSSLSSLLSSSKILANSLSTNSLFLKLILISFK